MKYGIIAGGSGSRLAGEGFSLPKPLVEIDGKPMIGRLIDIFQGCGAQSISVIVNSAMPEVCAYLKSLQQKGMDNLEFATAATPSSMHTLYELTKLMGKEGKRIVTTVDTIFREEDFRPYAESFESAGESVDGLMAVTSYIDDEKPLYVATDSEDFITAFLDRSEEGVKFVSGGIYGLTSPCLNVLEKCIDEGIHRMRNYQRSLLEAGLKIKAYDMGKIVDVDHIEDIAKARELAG